MTPWEVNKPSSSLRQHTCCAWRESPRPKQLQSGGQQWGGWSSAFLVSVAVSECCWPGRPPQPSAFYKALFSSPFIAFFFSFLSFCVSVQMLLCWRPFCLRLYLSKDIMSLVYTTWKTNQPVLCMKYWLKSLWLLGGAQNKFGGIRGRPFQRSSVTTVCQQGRQWKKVRIFRQQWSCQVFMRSLQPAQGWLIAVRCGTTNCKSEWKMWC